MQRTERQSDPQAGSGDRDEAELDAARGNGETEAADPQRDYQRCFIALVPDMATRAALSAIPVPPAARRVPYEQLHLTVTFIGALPLDRSAALIDAVTREAVPLKLAPVARIEHWPGASHPRLTVATIAMSDEFVALDWRVRSTMIALGLPVDARAFRPHVTLARYRRDAGAVGHAAELPAGLTARFEALTLYSSTLARNGARYRSLASAPVVYG
ncbi:RNA 2',3'-cyclic phosphodiesterase [Paraburkholderia phymatum]|uniref:RNA 2',3'-cyclic phosphodiesterase n=1 Tax=Paraburkholderia phymatum (strain DSM 17167 / CIP 108236 / LMG 21445 / STM815) TaxID=391038 RepID=B2JI12_PARP8|nr:RNA 2',3'-cyclic phosphodiesterase [Paraburkholderia phymatum]ACC71958.1 2'-5' RNA ligase [Paraburkholderia phymatum STM815]